MPFETLALGLTLTLPTSGTRNWGTTLKNTTWTKISEHRHTGSGDGNQMIAASIADRAIISSKLALNWGKFQSLTTLTPTGTTQTVDWDVGLIQLVNLGSASGDVTLTLNNPQSGGWYRLIVTQGATSRNLIWPASVLWPQAVDPILSTGNGEVDSIWLYFDGTNYYGEWELDYS